MEIQFKVMKRTVTHELEIMGTRDIQEIHPEDLEESLHFQEKLELLVQDQLIYCRTLGAFLEYKKLSRPAEIVRKYMDENDLIEEEISVANSASAGDIVEPPKIFISFNFQSKCKMNEIKKEIERRTGYKCWACEDEIVPGNNINQEIVNGIYAAKVVLCMMTQAYVDSIECEKEVNFAESLKRPIIYVHLAKMGNPLIKSDGLIAGMNLNYARSLYCKMYGDEPQLDALISGILKHIEKK